MKKIILLQSPLYRLLKDTQVVKRFRKRHRDEYLSEESELKSGLRPVGSAKDFFPTKICA